MINSIEDIKKLITTHHLQPNSKSQNRKLLEEGINLIKHRIEFNTLAESNLNVNDMHSWVKQLVTDKLHGTLQGTDIIWELKNETITLNPINGEFKCTSHN